MSSTETVEAARAKLEASLDRPSVARVYDYLLGGDNNYAIDREFAQAQLDRFPDLGGAAMANREFLGRVVRFAVEQGVRQFVDIGSGLPSRGNVHEVAERAAPGECRVVYVDNEPIAHAHATILLADTADTDRHHAIEGDFFDVQDLWQRIVDSGYIDPSRPVCLLVLALLHFMSPEQRPAQHLAQYQRQLPVGSMLAISHVCDELDDPELRQTVSSYRSTTNTMHMRTREETRSLFGGWALVEPGLVWLPEWRPDEPAEGDPRSSRAVAGVARREAAG